MAGIACSNPINFVWLMTGSFGAVVTACILYTAWAFTAGQQQAINFGETNEESVDA